MAIKYLKKAIKTPSTDDLKTRSAVQNILDDIEKRREEGIKEITKKFDKYEGEITVSKEKIEEAIKKVDQKTKDDVQFAHERIKRFAEHQLKSMNNNFEVELSKGLFAGQRLVQKLLELELLSVLVHQRIKMEPIQELFMLQIFAEQT